MDFQRTRQKVDGNSGASIPYEAKGLGKLTAKPIEKHGAESEGGARCVLKHF
jgi:hypothetical protein